MSIHSSLRAGGKGKKHRSVLKRYERLRVLKDKNLWGESKSVFGIPKVKIQKVKVKKDKPAPAADAVGTANAAAEPAPAGGAAAKTSEKK